MTYAKFDDNFAEHPKNLELSDGAFRLHVSGILYCSRLLTDGVVPKAKVPTLTPNYKPIHLRELVLAGMWTAPVGGSVKEYTIRDYLQWNDSRAKVLRAQAARAEGGRKGARKRWHKEDE